MIDLIIIGAGGFALEIVDLVEQINLIHPKFNILGFLDDNKIGEILPDLDVIGKLNEFFKYKECAFVIAIANTKVRSMLYTLLKKNEIFVPNLVHPNTVISRHATLEVDSGIIVNAYSTLSAKCKIHKGVIIDTNVYIGHETIIKEFATIYTGSLVAGNTVINSHSQIGLGANIIQGINIGENVVIGAGSTVISNIASNVIAVGTPCKIIKENK